MSGKSLSALLAAVKNGDAAQLEKLIKEGANVNAGALLCRAASTGNSNIVNILLENGIDILQLDKRGYSALHYAVSQNDFGTVKILLKNAFYNGKSRELLDMETKDTGNTALHLAAQLIQPDFRGLMDSSSYSMAILLLSYGAKFDKSNKHGIQPVDLGPGRHIAFVTILKACELQFKLVKMGSKPIGFLDTAGIGEYACVTNCRDSRGHTLLQVVLNQGRKDVMATLLKLRSERSSGFLVNEDQLELINLLSTQVKARARSLNEGLQKLLKGSSDAIKIFEEVLNDAKEIVSAVRLYERQTNIETIGNLDIRSIEESIEYFENEYRKMLQNDPKALTQLVMLAIYLPVQSVEQSIREAVLIDAVKRGDLQRLERCLDENPKISEKLSKSSEGSNKQDPMPFHILAMMSLENVSLANFCVAKIEKCYMALHLAAENNHLDIIKYLLKHGAVYCSRNYKGKTPEELTSNEKIVQYFKMIDKFFILARDDGAVLLTELKKLENDDDLLAIVKARDQDGCSLIDIVAKHQNIMEDFLRIVKGAEKNVKKY